MNRKDIFTVCTVVLTILTNHVVGYDYFGTKTSYFVNGNTDDSPVQLPRCKPALFWNLARHGSRNPGDDEILEMAEKLPSLRDLIVKTWEEGGGAMEEEEMFILMEWTFDIHVEDENLLTESGKLEHREMGERWVHRLGDLALNRGRTEVRSSSKSRCVESGVAFLQGVFETDLPVIHEDNKFLRFYDYCHKFMDEVEDNDDTLAESNKFEASEVYQEMISRVNINTGLPLDVQEVQLMWNICRYEKAQFPSAVSPWCCVFSDEDLKLFQFQEDLKYYYGDGAAYNITAEMTQPLFADIFNKIQEVQTSQEANMSILNFAHTDTLQPFIAALGLYKDQEDLLASDWGTPREDHMWQVSKIGSFATNVGLLVFECVMRHEKASEQKNSSESSDWKVMMYHQEKAIIQPACGAEVCSLDDFLETYRYLAEQDFDTVCENYSI